MQSIEQHSIWALRYAEMYTARRGDEAPKLKHNCAEETAAEQRVKEKDLPTPIGERAPINTPEANSGTVLDQTIICYRSDVAG